MEYIGLILVLLSGYLLLKQARYDATRARTRAELYGEILGRVGVSSVIVEEELVMVNPEKLERVSQEEWDLAVQTEFRVERERRKKHGGSHEIER